MNKTQKNTPNFTKENILNFPNKINIITIFLIFILYGLLLFSLAVIIFPKDNYSIQLNYEPSTYNEEINPFILVRGTATEVKKDNNETEIVNETRIFAYIRNLGSNKITKARYIYSGLDSSGVMRYLVESSANGSTVPTSHNSSITVRPGGGDFDKFFIKVRYNIGENENAETKVLTLSEEVLHLTKRELKSKNFSTDNTISEILTLNFTFADKGSSTQFESNFEIKMDDETTFHYLNMQSWIITEDGEIFPFLGLYNYRDKKSFKPSYITYVNKYIQPKWIYAKVNYTDVATNEVCQLFYKVSINELLNK